MTGQTSLEFQQKALSVFGRVMAAAYEPSDAHEITHSAHQAVAEVVRDLPNFRDAAEIVGGVLGNAMVLAQMSYEPKATLNMLLHSKRFILLDLATAR